MTANTIIVMRTAKALLLTASLAALCLALAACGSGTKTVSVAGAPATQPAQPSTGTTSRPPHTTSSPQSGSASTPTATRSAPEPAFTQQERGGEGVRAATALLRAKGFSPTNAADYHAHQALEVLIGMHSASGDGYGQQAFFFVNGRYIGTDASQPSATLRVVSQSDTEVTLSYPLYRNGDALCCPGGGQTKVRFQLNNGKLTALDPIPPLSRKAGLARY
jgi:hypothetical protein